MSGQDAGKSDPYLDAARRIIKGETPPEGKVWVCEELRVGPLVDSQYLWQVNRKPENEDTAERLDLFEPMRFRSMVSLANYLKRRAEDGEGHGAPSGPDREPEDWEVA